MDASIRGGDGWFMGGDNPLMRHVLASELRGSGRRSMDWMPESMIANFDVQK